jgi:hypothetical protein
VSLPPVSLPGGRRSRRVGDGAEVEERMANGGHRIFEGSYINVQGVVALLLENSFPWVSLFAAEKLSKLALLDLVFI